MRRASGQSSISCCLELLVGVTVDGVYFLDEGFYLFLKDVGVIAEVSFVWLELDHLLFVVCLDDATVECDYSEDGG